MSYKTILKSLYTKVTLLKMRFKNSKRSTEEIFSDIYQNNKWGGSKGDFYSGTGSTDAHAQQYSKVIKEFLLNNKVSNVVDLGCGDFTIGKSIQVEGINYTGIDIVPKLIERNNSSFSNANITFKCLNIINDQLPEGDVCLIRQVLQHLSNSQISSILSKTKSFKYVIITEHYPSPSVSPTFNTDKPHGEDTRIYDNSAVYIDKPPHSFTIEKVLLDVQIDDPLVSKGESIKTLLIQN